MCSASDIDNACGQGGSNGFNPAYDADQDCSLTNVDNACGASIGTVLTVITGGSENDEHNP